MEKIIRDSKGRFMKGNTGFWKGKHLTKESIRKRTESREGWKQSEEMKEKMRENSKINPNFGMRGKKQKEESIIKIVNANTKNGNYERKSEQMKINNPTKNPEIAKKIGETLKIKYSKEKHPLCERKQSKEEIDKRVITWKLNKQDIKQSERMKKNNPMKGRCGKNHPIYKKHHSEETKIKMKEKRKLQITPKFDTKIEIKIQNFLKTLGIDFFTHQYMKIEHGYQCDIFVPSMNLVIECDGDYWHSYPTGTDIDHIRTSELISKGFKVLRLWEFEIKGMTIKEFQEKIGR